MGKMIFNNIAKLMDEKVIEPKETVAQIAQVDATEGMKKQKKEVTPLTIDDIPKRYQRQYGRGFIPPLHRALFEAIKKMLDGKKEGLVILKDANALCHVSVPGSRQAMKSLEFYGYITSHVVYEPGMGRVGTYVNILKDID
jgi:hypothetical protein